MKRGDERRWRRGCANKQHLVELDKLNLMQMNLSHLTKLLRYEVATLC